MKSTHHDYKAIFAQRVGIFPLDLFQQHVHRLIGSNHWDLTEVNDLDSSLHNYHTMLDYSWRIYAFIDYSKKNRCSWNWSHSFRAFLMIGCPVSCPTNCFFMRTAIYIINKLQPFVAHLNWMSLQLRHSWIYCLCRKVTFECFNRWNFCVIRGEFKVPLSTQCFTWQIKQDLMVCCR